MEVDGKTLGAGAGMFATVIGVLTKLLYSTIGHRISAASQAAASAAAAAEKVEERRREDSIALHARLGEHIDRDVEMHERLMQTMQAQTQAIGQMHASLERALGERPTRDEVSRLIELSQGARP